jgi:hypothetical protein
MPASPASAQADFNQCYSLMLIWNPDGDGSASVSPTSSPGCHPEYFLPGTSITLTATPGHGHSFIEWMLSGSTSNPWTFQFPSGGDMAVAEFN